MNREKATEYVSFVVDDSLAGRELHADIHAIVREVGENFIHGSENAIIFEYASILIGWQCGFEPLFVAVHSYIDVRLEDNEAEEMAREYLEERGWFGENEHREADYIIR